MLYNVAFIWEGQQHNYDMVTIETVLLFSSIPGLWITVETNNSVWG